MNKGYIRLSEEEVRDFKLDSDLVEFQAVRDLVKFQENLEMKPAPKLSEAVLEKAQQRYGKMDVGTTMKIFDRDTSAGIHFMMSNGTYPQRYATTAHWFEQVAYWYQIVSNRGLGLAFSHKYPEQTKSQIDFLQKFSVYLSKTIISDAQKKAVSEGRTPALEAVQKSILMSTVTLIEIQDKILQDPEVEYFAAGRALGDPVESHNGHLRMYQKDPTPTQVKRFTKIISNSQFLTRIMGSNVDQDDSEFLTEFSDMKKLRALEDAKEMEDFEQLETDIDSGFDSSHFESFEDYAEASSLSYYAAFVLHKTICTNSKCDVCKTFLVVQNYKEDDQVSNQLLSYKEWKQRPGYLIRPTKLANDLFHTAEALFKLYRTQFYSQKNIKVKMVELVYQEIVKKAQFVDFPHKGHLKLVITRFMKGRLFFWANHMNKHDKKLLKDAKVDQSFASKSSRQLKAPELQ